MSKYKCKVFYVIIILKNVNFLFDVICNACCTVQSNNLIRLKITNKIVDSDIVIGTVNCKIVGKKTETKGIINNADLPLYIHRKKTVEFVIPVAFEHNKSIGANHQVIVEISDLLINGEKIDIQPNSDVTMVLESSRILKKKKSAWTDFIILL